MDTIKCKQCGAAMKYIPGANHIKCEYCGTEYRLKNNNDASIKNIDYMNKGALFYSYIPSGWSYRVFDDDKNNVSKLAAVCKGLRIDSPQNDTFLLFFPFAYYKSFNASASFGLKKNYTLDPVTFVRYKNMLAIQDYAKQRLKEIIPNADNIVINKLTDEDEFLHKKALSFVNESLQKLNADLNSSFGKYFISFEANSQKYYAIFSSVLVYKNNESPDNQKENQTQNIPDAPKDKNIFKSVIDFGMKGGIIGAKKRGENINIPNIKLPDLNKIKNIANSDWGKAFDIILVTSQNDINAFNTIFNDFMKNIRYANLYFLLQEEELRNVERIKLEGMRQRTQNAINSSQRISQTLSQTSDIVNSAYESRSRTMDNIDKMRSQAVRGVNEYESSYGDTYEASVEYDHIYQNADTFVGSKDINLDLGPEWEELKKK